MDHNKPYDRIDRVNNQILDILGDILIKHIDLRHLGFVTFTKIEVSRDLRLARVYYSVLNQKFSKNQLNIEINKYRKPFKKYLAPELTMKHTPDLRFYFDDTYEYTEYVSDLINSSIKVIINIDKPVGWTSFDIVKKAKRITGHKKVGHGGTLDPFASGVLILGTEDDTKNLTEITKSSKSYQAELLLGVKTNTLDPEGEITDKKHIPLLSDDILRRTMKTFEGKQKQIPPMFSAKKRGGVRLYKLARKNIEIERDEIDIEIDDISLVSFLEDKIIFNVSCSKGTYIRVLGSDIAKKLGTVGHLINLKRTRVGNYFIEDSISIENFEKSWKSYTK